MAKKDRKKKSNNEKHIPIGTAASEMLTLEPRIMLDAAAIATGAEVVVDTSPTVADTTGIQLPDSMEPALDPQDAAKDGPDANGDDTESTQLQPLGTTSDEKDNVELVIVDTSIANYETLIADLVNQDADSDTPSQDRLIEVIEIKPDADGILQINTALNNYDNISAVHILSHADEGQLYLGNTVLNTDSLSSYAETFSSWQSHLSDGADLLLYGCNVAEGEIGIDFVNQLSELTNTDIAASIDLTGHVDLGGDYVLEYSTGVIETTNPLSYNAMQQFYDVLDPVITVDKEADVTETDININDPVNYLVTIVNEGDMTAENIVIEDVIDDQVIFQDDLTVQVVNGDDNYSAVGNTVLAVGDTGLGVDPTVFNPALKVTGTLLDNEAAILGGGLSVITVNGMNVPGSITTFTANAGIITVYSDGSFFYRPPTGNLTTDSFTYQSTNGTVTLDSTVTIDFIQQSVWYVDPTFVGISDGSSTNPFTTFSPLNNSPVDVDGVNDIIYVNSNSIAGNITLENGQQLLGQGIDLTVKGFVLQAGGAKTQISGAALAPIVTIEDSNLIAGFDFNTGLGTGIDGNGDINLIVRLVDFTTPFGGGDAISLTNMGGSVLIEGVNINDPFSNVAPFGIDINNTINLFTNVTIRNSIVNDLVVNAPTGVINLKVDNVLFNTTIVSLNASSGGTINATFTNNTFDASSFVTNVADDVGQFVLQLGSGVTGSLVNGNTFQNGSTVFLGNSNIDMNEYFLTGLDACTASFPIVAAEILLQNTVLDIPAITTIGTYCPGTPTVPSLPSEPPIPGGGASGVTPPPPDVTTSFEDGTITVNVSELAPNSRIFLMYSTTIDPAILYTIPPSPTPVSTNTITVSGDNFTTQMDSVDVDILIPYLTVNKVADDDIVLPGEMITYTVTIENLGGADATGVSILDNFDPNVTPLGMFPDNIVISANSVMQFMVTVTVNDPFPDATFAVLNDVTVTSDLFPTLMSNTVTTIVQIDDIPEVELLKLADKDVVVPGDDFTYTLYLQNQSGIDLTNAELVDMLSENITDISISIMAVDLNDMYETIGNTELQVNEDGVFADRPSYKTQGSLFENDAAFWGETPTLITYNSTSLNGGTVFVDANGNFTYTPDAGFTGIDTFNYVAQDPTSGFEYIATVSIEVNDLVWYVDSSQAMNGTGTSTDPFNTLDAVNGVEDADPNRDFDEPGDFIYLFDTPAALDYDTTVFAIEEGQTVIGNGAPLIVNGVLLSDNISRPTINNVLFFGSGTLQGLTITETLVGNESGSTINISSADFNINGMTGGIEFNDVLLNVTLDNLISDASAGDPLVLNNLTEGSQFVVTDTTSITNSDNGIIVEDSINSTFDFGDTTITQTIASSNRALTLLNNTGSTFNFDSLNVTSKADIGGFYIQNSGTVNFNTAANYTSDVEVNNGNGVLDISDTDGTFANVMGSGFRFATTNITNTGNAKVIDLTNLNGFTLLGGTINATNTDATINAQNVTNISITGVTLNNEIDIDTFTMAEVSGNTFNGSFQTVNFSNGHEVIFSNNVTTSFNQVKVSDLISNGGAATVLIDNNMFNSAAGSGYIIDIEHSTAGEVQATITNNTLGTSSVSNGVYLHTENPDSDGAYDFYFDIGNNEFNLSTGAGLLIEANGDQSRLEGVVHNNTTTTNAGPMAFSGSSLTVQSTNVGTPTNQIFRIAVQDNNFTSKTSVNVATMKFDFASSNNPDLDFRITENSVANTGDGPNIDYEGNTDPSGIVLIQDNTFAQTMMTNNTINSPLINISGNTGPTPGFPMSNTTNLPVEPSFPAGFVFSPMYALYGENMIGTADNITLADANSLLQAAKDLWALTSVPAMDLMILDGLSISIVDLPGAMLGDFDMNTIYIDQNAANYGWFVDSTPLDASEFANPIVQMDLLTVIMHEMGHALGFFDVLYDASDLGIMTSQLDVGVRYLPPEASLPDQIIPVFEPYTVANNPLAIEQLTTPTNLMQDLNTLTHLEFIKIEISGKIVDIAPAGLPGEGFENTATFFSDFHGGGVDSNTVETVIDAEPIIKLTKSDGTDAVYPNTTLVYTITAENIGNQHAQVLQITDFEPNNLIYNPGLSDPGWNVLPDGTYEVDLATLNVGDGPFEIQIAFDVPINFPPTVSGASNTVQIIAAGPPLNFDDSAILATVTGDFTRVIFGSGILWTYDAQYYYDLGRYDPLPDLYYELDGRLISLDTMDSFVNMQGSRNIDYYDSTFGVVDFHHLRTETVKYANWPAIQMLLLSDVHRNFPGLTSYGEQLPDHQIIYDNATPDSNEQLPSTTKDSKEVKDNNNNTEEQEQNMSDDNSTKPEQQLQSYWQGSYRSFSDQLTDASSKFEQRRAAFASAAANMTRTDAA